MGPISDFSKTATTLGKLSPPAPLKTLAAQTWDAIIIGAGHNGLTCAAYLARAGKKVLVLESRPKVGGACTLEETFPGVKFSPCAYVVGLLHPLVLRELEMKRHGFEWTPAESGMFVPFEDGSSVQLWNDDEKCDNEVKRFAPQDYKGWKAMTEVKSRLRDALRPDSEKDIWIGNSPSREAIEERLGNDTEAKKMLFEWSMAEYVDNFLTDERLKMAYYGQGTIGTNASPTAPGTASIYYHHGSGRMDGLPGTWGYVKGGMGMISFILCDIARSHGATIATETPVAQILPGEGVVLESGERLLSAHVISNADPVVTARLLGNAVDPEWKSHTERVPIKGVTVKVNLTLSELPNFSARPGTNEPHHYGQINTPLTRDEWDTAHREANAGILPKRLWTELYLHTAYDRSVAPAHLHTLSIFSQFVPNQFKEGTWDTRREEVGKTVLSSIGRFATNIPSAVVDLEVLGPPDIEKRVGLTGGHIFQGEILPDYMWDKRLSARTPMPGVYLCGACTHPGGSVMGINGRNAAMEVLKNF